MRSPILPEKCINFPKRLIKQREICFPLQDSKRPKGLCLFDFFFKLLLECQTRVRLNCTLKCPVLYHEVGICLYNIVFFIDGDVPPWQTVGSDALALRYSSATRRRFGEVGCKTLVRSSTPPTNIGSRNTSEAGSSSNSKIKTHFIRINHQKRKYLTLGHRTLHRQEAARI